MGKNAQYLFLALVSLMFTACAPQITPQPFTPVDLSSQVRSGQYQKSVDNFMVIFDASSSMGNTYEGARKFAQAKVVADNLNNTLPALDIQAGIRAFGPRGFSLANGSSPLYGMTKYSHQGFSKAMAALTSPGGLTPLPGAFEAAARDLSGTSGPIAVILISDAENVGQTSVDAARAMKKIYGDRLCIYPVLIGNGAGSREVMEQIASTSGCGFVSDYAALSTPQGMADFVKKVFLKAAVDSDGDGVVDQFDHCPNTPRGVKVDKNGCQIKTKAVIGDSDHDGVPNSRDLCPDTPLGIKVDKDGCPLPITSPQTIELQVRFNFDKDIVRPVYDAELAKFAKFMKAHPEISVTLEGYTDNVGSRAYNQALSQRRAMSVKRYLESHFGLNPARLKTVGYGFSRPVASNNTPDGRRMNRRVYATLSVQ